MLIEEQLNKMNWTRIESELLSKQSQNMNLEINHAETVIKSSTVLQFTFKRRSRSSEHENHSFVTKTSDVRKLRSSEHKNHFFATKTSDVKRLKSSKYENYSFTTEISDVRRSRSSEHKNHSFITKTSDVNMYLSSSKFTLWSVLITCQSSRLLTSISSKSSHVQLIVFSISSTSTLLKMMKWNT